MSEEERKVSLNPGIAIYYGPLRVEERLLFDEVERRGIPCDRIDNRSVRLTTDGLPNTYDVVIARGVAQQRTFHTVTMLEAMGVAVVNPSHVLERCNDKVRTSALLAAAGVPQPRYRVAFSSDSALDAVEELGYPAVVKPAVGSWGRLLAKVNDRDAAETVFEHRETLGSFHHNTHYIQEYIDKGPRDIRAFVIGGETICAIYRSADHWITNTARGGVATNCPVTPELADICSRTADAIGEGILAVDLFEDPERGLLVNEVNATIEFRNSIDTTGVNIPGCIIDYVLSVAEEGTTDPAGAAEPARV